MIKMQNEDNDVSWKPIFNKVIFIKDIVNNSETSFGGNSKLVDIPSLTKRDKIAK